MIERARPLRCGYSIVDSFIVRSWLDAGILRFVKSIREDLLPVNVEGVQSDFVLAAFAASPDVRELIATGAEVGGALGTRRLDKDTRARIVVGRCFSGSIYVVTGSLPLGNWPYQVVYEWGALFKALVLYRIC